MNEPEGPTLCFVDCKECGSPFRQRKRSSRFCSKSCASRRHGRQRSGPTNANWRGGKASHPLYKSWTDIIGRCYRPSHQRFADYGGRGITVCDAWREDFWTFAADVGPRPPGRIMDRTDNDGPYAPGNVRWVTPSESDRNRRPTHLGRSRNEKGQFV